MRSGAPSRRLSRIAPLRVAGALCARLCALTLAALALLPAHGALAGSLFTAAQRPHQWAVIIGISAYEDPSISPLAYAERDALALEDALRRGGIPPEQILTLLGPEATLAATRALIAETLPGQLAADPRARLVVYWAGHGATADGPAGGEMGYLLPYDADPQRLPETGLSMETLTRGFSPFQAADARHVLFLVDACYSGYAIRTGRLLTQRVYAPDRAAETLWAMERRPSIQLLTAGARDQEAGERDGAGIFTRALLQGLEGPADLDGDALVTFDELAHYVRLEVGGETRQRQTPMRASEGDGQFVFVLDDALEAQIPVGMALSLATPRSLEGLSRAQLETLLRAERAGRRRAALASAALTALGAGLVAYAAHDYLGAEDRLNAFQVDGPLFVAGAGALVGGISIDLTALRRPRVPAPPLTLASPSPSSLGPPAYAPPNP